MEDPQTLGSGIGPLMIASLRVAGFLALIGTLAPVHVIYTIIRPDDAFDISRFFHRILVRILGFRVRVHGMAATTRPVLFVANHSSYLDIPVLAKLIPGAFVAKAEVANWPLFGVMAKLQHTLFIERRSAHTRMQTESMQTRLARGQNLILFPEGTSSDGLGVLPFRSGLFAALEEKNNAPDAMVQPVSIACTELDGLPITRAWRPYYSWFGDMTLVSHLWNVFKVGRFTVDVVFHAPVAPASFADRKALAGYCQRQVAAGVQRCLTGRLAHAGDKAKITAPEASLLVDAPQG